jgi:hypothetical protein
VHAPTEDKDDDIKDSFYKEIEQVFYQFPRYNTKILLGDFNAKIGREAIFKPIIGNESLYEVSNDNGVRHTIPNQNIYPLIRPYNYIFINVRITVSIRLFVQLETNAAFHYIEKVVKVKLYLCFN